MCVPTSGGLLATVSTKLASFASQRMDCRGSWADGGWALVGLAWAPAAFAAGGVVRAWGVLWLKAIAQLAPANWLEASWMALSIARSCAHAFGATIFEGSGCRGFLLARHSTTVVQMASITPDAKRANAARSICVDCGDHELWLAHSLSAYIRAAPHPPGEAESGWPKSESKAPMAGRISMKVPKAPMIVLPAGRA